MVSAHEPSNATSIWDVVVDRLPQQADTPMRLIARTLGVKTAEAAQLLQLPATRENLLKLHQQAQYRHLALVKRLWPHCPWLTWQGRDQGSAPTLHLILNTFGQDLLDYVEKKFGRQAVLDYWYHLEIPPAFDDLELDPEAEDPLEDVPEDQWVFNPHIPEEEVGESFVFGTVEAARCFAWLIAKRANYSLYVDNWTGYHHDPLGIQLAYDLRDALKHDYWSTLPPDTFPAYLALARALQNVTVPEAFEEGRLPLVQVVKAATLPTDSLDLIQASADDLSWDRHNRLTFERQPVHIYVLDTDTDMSPPALILTTRDEPGNPERLAKGWQFRYLSDSDETMALALIPRQWSKGDIDFEAIEEALEATLSTVLYGVNEDLACFCITRANPFFGEASDSPIKVVTIPGGYFLHFNPDHTFDPTERYGEFESEG